jgi:pyruvate ferredoxin oxidoreductase alpha subunit
MKKTIKEKKELLEGSRAIALTIKNIEPEVISAYPITPQTHIVEDLAKFKANGQADYQYILAESEFAAASIILGASATGARAYSATSSQGLLLMTEVLYNISGLRLPLVMTIANRAIGAPISIWNDHSDAMAVRDAGWIMLFAGDHQEAVNQHILAYKLTENLKLPVMVNVDGFIITHSYDSVIIPSKKTIKKFLPSYKPQANTCLDPKNPITMGAFFTPPDYWQERERLHKDLCSAQKKIKDYYKEWQKIFPIKPFPQPLVDNGLVEYLGPKNAQTIIIAMGSVSGTIKEVLKNQKNTALLRIKSYRPFPEMEIKKLSQKAKQIIVLEKAIAPGSQGGPLFLDVQSALRQTKIDICNYIIGLGGKDVSETMIEKIIHNSNKNKSVKFV